MASTSADTSISVKEYIESQERLLQEASLALPGTFTKCTYTLGSIRQPVYLCLQCPESRGLCSSCSTSCHTDHEQLELFPKRNFRCDCPTEGIKHPCTLHKLPEEINTGNIYGRNFKREFCRCGRPYDPHEERETMIQCLACEDWYHESCLNLRERPAEEDEAESKEEETEPTQDDDEHSDSGLPPPLISADEYDAFVCASCVCSIDTLRRWAGTEGINMITRESVEGPWKSTALVERPDNVNIVDEQPETGSKRVLSQEPENTPATKRLRPSDTGETCLAPPVNTLAQEIITAKMTHPLGKGDIFLTEGWRERWCKCDRCMPSLKEHPYLLEEEETYEPPPDPDADVSLEELGLRALANLPRERSIEGIHAFIAMKDSLVKYLKPFAEQGNVVNPEDVTNFFEELKNAQREGKKEGF